MQYQTIPICLFFAFLNLSILEAHNNTDTRRAGKLFSVFQVIRFPNDACTGSGNSSGTCYTSAECNQKGGTNMGTCAQGYGVCCVFSLSCGATSSQNCTFFTSPGNVGPGQCKLTVCKCNPNICQLRLDFMTFTISQPSTSIVTVGKTINGQLSPNAPASITVKVATATQCLLDTFTVTNPGGNTPPVICGSNNMEHMYVDASDCCNDLDFQLGQANALTGAAVAARSWNIKVTQFSCDFNNLAPPGCTMYFFNTAGTDIFRSYNFNGGTHLANQHQSICVRREIGMCRICWSATAAIDFLVSGLTTAATANTVAMTCCQYKDNGKNVKGFDCVSIPGAVTMNAASIATPQRICGRKNGLGRTVCSNQQPFIFNFYSDNFEIAIAAISEATIPGKGIQIAYQQKAMLCSP